VAGTTSSAIARERPVTLHSCRSAGSRERLQGVGTDPSAFSKAVADDAQRRQLRKASERRRPARPQRGWRTFAVRLRRRGYDLRIIREVLGLATLSATKNLVEGDPVDLGRIVAKVI